MNLTDIDPSKAKPIDFDDIREGDTAAVVDDHSVTVFTVARVVPGRQAHVLAGDGAEWSMADGQWFLLGRPAPEPGASGTATVKGVPGVRVVRNNCDVEHPWLAPAIAGDPWLADDDVTDFVPDSERGIPDALADALDEYVRHVRGSLIDPPEMRVVGTWRDYRNGHLA